jgi:SAM-dependent methyltransferase
MQVKNIAIKQEGMTFWDANPCGGSWSSYREFMDWIRRTEPYIFDILDGYNWKGKRVVEVGCGQGTTLNYMPAFGAVVYGLDMSLESIGQARSGAIELNQLASIHLLGSDAEQLPFKAEAFDMAICVGVLHHTSDTAGGVREIHRLLKPGGQAVVMLYRSGNPKWWATKLLRGFGGVVDFFSGRPSTLAEHLRSRRDPNNVKGTALLELFGVPILKAFSNREARAMFADFTEIRITNHQPGFQRLIDVLPDLRVFKPILAWLDRSTSNLWGFYQVIEAHK